MLGEGFGQPMTLVHDLSKGIHFRGQKPFVMLLQAPRQVEASDGSGWNTRRGNGESRILKSRSSAFFSLHPHFPWMQPWPCSKGKQILADGESWWPDKMRNLVWVLRLIVITVIHVPDLTTDVQWPLHGSTAIMCVIRCQVNFVERAIINWMNLTMSYHHLIFSLSSNILRSFQLHCLETAVKCPEKFLCSFPQEV